MNLVKKDEELHVDMEEKCWICWTPDSQGLRLKCTLSTARRHISGRIQILNWKIWTAVNCFGTWELNLVKWFWKLWKLSSEEEACSNFWIFQCMSFWAAREMNVTIGIFIFMKSGYQSRSIALAIWIFWMRMGCVHAVYTRTYKDWDKLDKQSLQILQTPSCRSLDLFDSYFWHCSSNIWFYSALPCDSCLILPILPLYWSIGPLQEQVLRFLNLQPVCINQLLDVAFVRQYCTLMHAAVRTHHIVLTLYWEHGDSHKVWCQCTVYRKNSHPLEGVQSSSLSCFERYHNENVKRYAIQRHSRFTFRYRRSW